MLHASIGGLDRCWGEYVVVLHRVVDLAGGYYDSVAPSYSIQRRLYICLLQETWERCIESVVAYYWLYDIPPSRFKEAPKPKHFNFAFICPRHNGPE